jgi:hypothetical protein
MYLFDKIEMVYRLSKVGQNSSPIFSCFIVLVVKLHKYNFILQRKICVNQSQSRINTWPFSDLHAIFLTLITQVLRPKSEISKLKGGRRLGNTSKTRLTTSKSSGSDRKFFTKNFKSFLNSSN